MRCTRPLFLLAAGTSLVWAQDAARLRQDVEYLVKPELLGRETGQPGCVKAATYLANRMRDLGLTPLTGAGMGGETPFHYTYALSAGVAPSLVAGGLPLVPVEDFEAVGEGLNLGESVYLGFGIQDAGLGWDDYAGRQVEGRWVVVDEGHPEGWDALGFVPAATVEAKAAAAQAAGALGLVLLRGHQARKALWTTEDWNRNGAYGLIAKVPPKKPKLPFPKVALTESGTAKLMSLPEARGFAAWTPGSPFLPIELETPAALAATTASDIVGMIPGTDAALRGEVVLVTAHFDHVGGSSASSFYPGADDNASGTAGLLELATLLRDAKPRRSIVFLACSGEEKGLLGSEAFAANPPLSLSSVVANVNLDMIGRNATEDVYITPAAVSNQVNTLVTKARDLVKTKALRLNKGIDPYWQQSDHYSFAKRGVNVVFFNSGLHADLHKTTDTLDKLNLDKMVRIVDLARDLVLATANDAARPAKVASSVYSAWSWPVVGSAGDTTAPTVGQVAASGSSGTVTLSASATDAGGVTKVEFRVDGTLAGTDTAAPFAVAFDTTKVADGSHALQVKAYDAAGNVGTASVTWTVANGGGGAVAEVEPNDTRATAQALGSAVTKVTGTLKATTDQDHFALTVPAGRTLKVGMVGPSGTAYDYDLYLLNAAGTVVAKSEGSTSSESLSWTAGTAAAAVTVRVKSYKGSSTTAGYTLTLTR